MSVLSWPSAPICRIGLAVRVASQNSVGSGRGGLEWPQPRPRPRRGVVNNLTTRHVGERTDVEVEAKEVEGILRGDAERWRGRWRWFVGHGCGVLVWRSSIHFRKLHWRSPSKGSFSGLGGVCGRCSTGVSGSEIATTGSRSLVCDDTAMTRRAWVEGMDVWKLERRTLSS